MNDSRAQILRRILRALPKSDQERRPDHISPGVGPSSLLGTAQDFSTLVKKFQREFEQTGAEMRVCSNEPCAIEFIRRFIEEKGFQTVAISRHKICLRLNLVERLSEKLPRTRFFTEGIDSENPYERARLKEQMARVPLSITGIEYLIAETGTLVAWSHPEASRQISLLPEVHIALATIDQIRPNLSELFAEIQAKYGANLPGSAITLITGPSRTADIEKVLIKGVHGPTQLVAVLLENLE